MSSLLQLETGFDLRGLDALFRGHAPRLQHMRDAAAFARDLRASFALCQESARHLERSALLHDIGYAPSLHRFGFHPLDGALFLETQGEHPWVVEGVLRHSLADRKRPEHPDVRAHYLAKKMLVDAAWLVRAVTIADWRAAGVGGRVSFGRRLEDIVTRNADNTEKIRRATDMVDVVRDWFCAWAAALPGLPWIFCDLDNTLVPPGQAFPAVNTAAIRAYVAAGGRISLATGKHPLAIAALVRDLDLPTPQIAANGTCLLEQGGIRVLAHLENAARDLVTGIETLGLPFVIYRTQGIEAGTVWSAEFGDLFEYYGELRPEAQVCGPALKILCLADAADVRREEDLRGLARSMDVDCCRSDAHFLEFQPRTGNKGQATRTVMEEFGWPVLHSLGIGDAENDESLFALCGGCAAVGNAAQTLQREADWILGPCVHGGVGEFLDRVRHGGWQGLRAGNVRI